MLKHRERSWAEVAVRMVRTGDIFFCFFHKLCGPDESDAFHGYSRVIIRKDKSNAAREEAVLGFGK
jgi:hypothetical protein